MVLLSLGPLFVTPEDVSCGSLALRSGSTLGCFIAHTSVESVFVLLKLLRLDELTVLVVCDTKEGTDSRRVYWLLVGILIALDANSL